MQVKAIEKHIGVSPRKVRLVLDVVRGKKVDEALAILKFMPTPVARNIAKAVKSAAANAENNYQLEPTKLIIVSTFADGERMMRRVRAGSRGRPSPFYRKSSQITIVVEEK